MSEPDEWLHPEGTPISRFRSRGDSPPTPTSSYSRSDNAATPPSGGDDLTASIGNLGGDTPEHLKLPQEIRQSAHWQGSNSSPPNSPPFKSPKRRKGFIRQQPSPPASGHGDTFDDNDNASGLEEHEAHDVTPARRGHIDVPDMIEPTAPSSPRARGFSIARKPLPALPDDN